MKTTHVGKIGRLPKDIREELGRRLENGVPGTEIVKWLNGGEEVRAALAEWFGGRPITEQNLSDWRQTGHVEWLRRQEARLAAAHLTEQAEELDEAAQRTTLGDRLATVVASEMAQLAMALLEPERDLEKRWDRLCGINRELARLRREDHRAGQVAIAQARWQWELHCQSQENLKRAREEHKKRLMGLLMAEKEQPINAAIFGGDERGRKMADMFHRLKYDLPIDDLLDEGTADGGRAAEVGEQDAEVRGRQKGPGKAGREKCGGRGRERGRGRGRTTAAQSRDERAAKKPEKTQKSGLIQPNPTRRKGEDGRSGGKASCFHEPGRGRYGR
jgi:hypothetical protein